MWAAQPGPQAEAISADWCREIFFGGARGGGKSAFLLGDFLQDVHKYGRAWQGVIFRRTYPELQELIKQSRSFYEDTFAAWFEQKKEWVWPNGACLKFRYIENVRDASRYQGHEYSFLAFDELQQWADPDIYHQLKACLRSSIADVPTKRIRATGNPGGVGHQWVKSYFIDPYPAGFKAIDDLETKTCRMFIPSRVDDNKILLLKDPNYKEQLKGVGSAQLVRMWLEGDWNVIAGSFFDIFNNEHIVEPFAVPLHWPKYRAFDWGSYRPFCCLWAALASEDYQGIPRGSFVVYREYYGMGDKPNVGLKLTVEEVAHGILSRQKKGEIIDKSVADPSIFKEDGGPSLAERFHKSGVKFTPADNARAPGWDQVRARLLGEERKPRLYIFSNCTNLIRTLPIMQHDPANPEDLNSELEDHPVDTLRYLVMSRPYLRDKPKEIVLTSIQDQTYDDVLRQHRRARAREAE